MLFPTCPGHQLLGALMPARMTLGWRSFSAPWGGVGVRGDGRAGSLAFRQHTFAVSQIYKATAKLDSDQHNSALAIELGGTLIARHGNEDHFVIAMMLPVGQQDTVRAVSYASCTSWLATVPSRKGLSTSSLHWAMSRHASLCMRMLMEEGLSAAWSCIREDVPS